MPLDCQPEVMMSRQDVCLFVLAACVAQWTVDFNILLWKYKKSTDELSMAKWHYNGRHVARNRQAAVGSRSPKAAVVMG
jgi:hypothetical protein